VRPDDVYTHGHHESVVRAHTWRTIANSAAYLEPSLAPGLSLLDVGCGPGTITAEFADRLAPGRVVGLDHSADIVTTAAATLADWVNAEAVVGDAYALDFADNTFDIVHAHQMLQHLSDPVAALREMARVCRPGGIVAARDGDYGAFFWAPANPAIDQWLDVYRKVARHNGAEPDAGRRIATWAAAAGLDNAVLSFSVWSFTQPEERQWWGDLWAERVTSSALADQIVEYGLGTKDDCAAMAKGFRTWLAEPTAAFVVPHGELIARISPPA
jgi:ubiquinone/menaquinone biosynthesis C-methylase UbiE